MNERATYELTIAEKLEQLKAPQLVDSIWARIEAQLDLDMPTDDGPSNPPAPPTAGPGKWIGGSLLGLILLFFLYQFINDKQQTAPANQPLIESPASNSTTEQTAQPPPNTTPVPAQQPVKNKVINNGVINKPDSSSSNTLQQPLVLPAQDNAAGNENVLPQAPQINLPPNPAPDTTTKKSRGVKGINNDDYRIVPKKDQ